MLVTVRLRGPVADPRQRFALARQLGELGASFAELKQELAATLPVVARAIPRAQAALFAQALAAAGVEFTVSPARSASPRAGVTKPWLAAALLAVLLGGGGVAVSLRRRAPMPSPASVPVALPPPPVEPVAAVVEPQDAAVPARPPKRSLESVITSVVALRCAKSVGSGFFVTPSQVLTNAHVLCPEGDSMQVATPSGARGTGRVVRSDDKLDLALLEVSGLTGEPLEVIDATSLRVGEAVSMVGSPQGLDFTAHLGTLSFLGRYRLGVAYLQVDMAVNPGNSGGPIVNESGQVVGVMSMMLTNANNIGLALPINYVLDGTRPVWPDAPVGLRSDGWRALKERVAKEDGLNAAAARDSLSRPSVVRAEWLDEGRLHALVISPHAEGDQRRMEFKLVRGEEVLCEMFQTKTLKWDRVNLAGSRLDPQVREWIQTNRIDENVYWGVIEVQFSSCRKAFEPNRLPLALEVESSGAEFKRISLSPHPTGLKYDVGRTSSLQRWR